MIISKEIKPIYIFLTAISLIIAILGTAISVSTLRDNNIGIFNSENNNIALPTPSSWVGVGVISASVLSVTPKVVYVSVSSYSPEPGSWLTIRVNVTNEGPDTAPIQTIHIGLPFDPPSSDIQIVYTDLSDGAQIYPKGSTIWARGQEIKAKYPIIEGWQIPMPKGLVRTLVIRVRIPENISVIAFDVKTVACDESWKIINSDPKSGMIDQQGEYVYSYLIFRKFAVSISPGQSKDIDIDITNYNRYPPSWAGSQPSMKVESFSVIDYGGFKGSITALNLGLTIPPGSTGKLTVRVTAASDCPGGTYIIKYKVTGSP